MIVRTTCRNSTVRCVPPTPYKHGLVQFSEQIALI